MNKAEGFEVTEYSDPKNEAYAKYSAIYQIMQDKEREAPNCGVRVSFVGNMLKLYYHCYEMHLPTRMKEVTDESETMIREALKYIKKELKKRKLGAIDFKEDKSLANYTVQKVSLNERYYAVFWKFYELG